MKKVSFVIPCYRSEHTLPHVVAEIEEKMKTMEQYEYDIFLVTTVPPMTPSELYVGCAGSMKTSRGLVSQKILGSTRLLWPDFAIPTEIM